MKHPRKTLPVTEDNDTPQLAGDNALGDGTNAEVLPIIGPVISPPVLTPAEKIEQMAEGLLDSMLEQIGHEPFVDV